MYTCNMCNEITVEITALISLRVSLLISTQQSTPLYGFGSIVVVALRCIILVAHICTNSAPVAGDPVREDDGPAARLFGRQVGRASLSMRPTSCEVVNRLIASIRCDARGRSLIREGARSAFKEASTARRLAPAAVAEPDARVFEAKSVAAVAITLDDDTGGYCDIIDGLPAAMIRSKRISV
jgi:hypothetical protein